MKTKRLIASIMPLLLLVSLMAQASMSHALTLHGTVTDFDQHTITLAIEKGVLKVPREKYARNKDLRPGQRIELQMDVEEFKKLFSSPSQKSR